MRWKVDDERLQMMMIENFQNPLYSKTTDLPLESTVNSSIQYEPIDHT